MRLTRGPEVAQRLSSSVAVLDDTIREIRQSIFSLRCPAESGTSLRHEVLAVLREAAQVLAFGPMPRFEDPVDNAVPATLIPQLKAVPWEALVNIGRHAEASTALWS